MHAVYIIKEVDMTNKLREGQVVIGTKGHQRDCNGDSLKLSWHETDNS